MFQALGGRSLQAARLCARRRAVLVEAVRGRKSRSDPIAKSKEGRIKTPPPVDPVEMLVLRERYTEYELVLRALRSEFKEELLRKKYEEETGSLAEERAKKETEEHLALMAWNREENQRMLQLRMQRLQKEREEAEQKELEAVLEREQQQQELIRMKEEELLQLQEAAKHFITMENLDQKIEEAMDNPKNYNFAIDKEGRIIKQTVLK